MALLQRCWWWCAVLALVACQRQGPPPPEMLRVRVDSQPQGAAVFLDGQPTVGITPTLITMHAGDHFLELRLDGFEAHYVPVRRDAGREQEVKVALVPATAPVVVESIPSGALARLNGEDIGETPAFVRQVPLGDHRLRLSREGYADHEVEFSLTERRPRKLVYDLVSRMGRALVWTDPPGAEVFLDGNFRGTTPDDGRQPLEIRDVISGEHELTIRKKSYRELTHKFVLASQETRQLRTPTMLVLPGAVSIATEPEGASVFRGDEWVGRTPVTLADLPPGDIELRLTKEGYSDALVTTTVQPGLTRQIQKQLTREKALLVLVTEPAECTVWLNSRRLGVTMRSDNPSISRNFTVDNIEPGQYVLKVEHPQYDEYSERVRFLKGETLQRQVTLKQRWLPTHVLTLKDNKQYRGRFVRWTQNGDAIFQTAPGIETLYRKDEVKSVEPL